MDNITIIFDQDNIKTTFIVRSKNGSKPSSNNYNLVPQIPVDSTLKLLGLERVPLNELVPKYKQINPGDKLIGQQCLICQENYNIKEYQRELHCNHHFHKKCIDKWLKNNLTCPYCRTSIGNTQKLNILKKT
jgi:hypothetical protein